MAPDAFHERIHNSLADPNLQEALDQNAERRLKARETAYMSLPEPWEMMRKRAHTVRAEMVANLDFYLDQFVTRAQSNGMTIHHATDANEANKIILAIANKNRAKLIAKSKSMVSEEIGVNHALQSEGLRVIETDLGEYIVQLRGERPAHIITPAVHLRRQEIGKTFQEKLGFPYTEDIPTLTSAARKVLRQVFLDADIGLSGVNFGVADTGTMCIITNEGNGRLVTSLPPIHIALMGIERLVPTLDDLALMLYLLPRSATGQKITVYTNLIHGPVNPHNETNVGGPRERHLILIDNGRTRLRSSSLTEALYCIRCGACLNACPVFQEIGGHAYVNKSGISSTYPGPIGSVISPGLFGGSEYGYLARASSLCGACKEACPVDIDLPKLLLRIRAGQTPDKSPTASSSSDSSAIPGFLFWGLKFFTWLAVESRRYAFFQKLASVFGGLTSGWMRLPDFTGWGYSKDFPSPPKETFRARWKKTLEGRQKSLSETNLETKNDTLLKPGQEVLPVIQGDPEQNDRSSLNKLGKEQLLDRFKQELSALDGNFIHCKSSDLAGKVIKILRERGIQSILTWEENYLPRDIIPALLSEGLKVQSNLEAIDGEKVSKKQIPQAGLTGARAAIAETGTLVLPEGDGRSPLASLLPDIHLAVIDIHDLYPNLSSILQLEEVTHSPSTILISGPSRTADIEMTLTIGVHGPKEIYVFCVDDQVHQDQI